MINGNLLTSWQTSSLLNLPRQPLSVKAGRGNLFLLDHPRGTIVERQYKHGGLRRLFLPHVFLATDRAEQELLVHIRVFKEGIATCEPVGWREASTGLPFLRRYFYYTAYLPDAQPLPRVLDKGLPGSVFQAMANSLHQLYQTGITHADLNLNNWLVVANQPYLIDFDKATSQTTPPFDYLLACIRRTIRSGRKLGFTHAKFPLFRFVLAAARLFGVEARGLLAAIPEQATHPGLLERFRWKLSGGHTQ